MIPLQRTKVAVSKDIIKLFQKKAYEDHVLNMMNQSNTVFEDKYSKIDSQSKSEPDFESNQGIVFDAKIPFEKDQIGMLVDGKAHPPKIKEWLDQLIEEVSHMDIDSLRSGNYIITNNRLYRIMFKQIKEEIEKEKKFEKKYKENIIFFLPFQIGRTFKSIFEELSDNADIIYNHLASEEELNLLKDREVFLICPTGNSHSEFLIRNLSQRKREYINYSGLEEFFAFTPEEL